MTDIPAHPSEAARVQTSRPSSCSRSACAAATPSPPASPARITVRADRKPGILHRKPNASARVTSPVSSATGKGRRACDVYRVHRVRRGHEP